jgi:hypothetical protein
VIFDFIKKSNRQTTSKTISYEEKDDDPRLEEGKFRE